MRSYLTRRRAKHLTPRALVCESGKHTKSDCCSGKDAGEYFGGNAGRGDTAENRGCLETLDKIATEVVAVGVVAGSAAEVLLTLASLLIQIFADIGDLILVLGIVIVLIVDIFWFHAGNAGVINKGFFGVG